jgi:very-short-patch-repair endonuclease
LRLVIEVDGEGHFTGEGREYDLERTRKLEGYGLQVLRFTNYQVMNEFEGVCEVIQGLVDYPP